MIFTHWLNFNQFADNDDFAASVTQLNKLSRELSTESVDTFLTTSGATLRTIPRSGRLGCAELRSTRPFKTKSRAHDAERSQPDQCVPNGLHLESSPPDWRGIFARSPPRRLGERNLSQRRARTTIPPRKLPRALAPRAMPDRRSGALLR